MTAYSDGSWDDLRPSDLYEVVHCRFCASYEAENEVLVLNRAPWPDELHSRVTVWTDHDASCPVTLAAALRRAA